MESNEAKVTLEDMLGVVEDAQRVLFKHIVETDDKDQEENLSTEYEDLIYLKQDLINARYEIKRLHNKIEEIVKKFRKLGLGETQGGDDTCQK